MPGRVHGGRVDRRGVDRRARVDLGRGVTARERERDGEGEAEAVLHAPVVSRGSATDH